MFFTKIETVEEALDRLVLKLRKKYDGKDADGNYLIDGERYTKDGVIQLANSVSPETWGS
jgi:hypothetical protein